MPDFKARICKDYRDVNGLILDCRPEGLVRASMESSGASGWTNSAPPARAVTQGTHTDTTSPSTLKDATKYWRSNQHVGKVAINLTDGSSGLVAANTPNTVTATLTGGTANSWQNGDNYVLTTFRPGSPYQNTSANRPNIVSAGSVSGAQFDRAYSEYFCMDVTYPVQNRYFTTMVDVASMDGASNGQALIGFPNFAFRARNGSGNYEYEYNSTAQPGSQALNAGVWLLNAESGTSAKVWRDGTEMLSGTFGVMDVAAGEPEGYIGSADGSSEFLDATLRHVAMWDRRLSPLERDFVFGSFHHSTSHSAYTRPTVTVEEWTDDTDSTQASRLNPQAVRKNKYLLATGAVNSRLQVACEVDGYVQSDGALSSRLFTHYAVEHPSATPPVFHTETGWSSVIDVQLTGEGHHSFIIYREGGGGILFHVDVEIS